MKDVTCDKIHKVYALLKVLAVMAILLVMASSAASAVGFSGITTNPTTISSNSAGMAMFTITLNVIDVHTATPTASLTVEGNKYEVPLTLGPNNTATGTTDLITTYQTGWHNIHVNLHDGTDTFYSNNPGLNIG